MPENWQVQRLTISSPTGGLWSSVSDHSDQAEADREAATLTEHHQHPYRVRRTA